MYPPKIPGYVIEAFVRTHAKIATLKILRFFFRNSAPPAAPRNPCSLPDNIRLPDIIYVYILSRSRHHSFCFWFFWSVIAYCTQLLSQAMYNLMMATTMAETCSCYLPSTIQLHNNNIVVFDYFIHSLHCN